jgi:hypothetical protein
MDFDTGRGAPGLGGEEAGHQNAGVDDEGSKDHWLRWERVSSTPRGTVSSSLHRA